MNIQQTTMHNKLNLTSPGCVVVDDLGDVLEVCEGLGEAFDDVIIAEGDGRPVLKFLKKLFRPRT